MLAVLAVLACGPDETCDEDDGPCVCVDARRLPNGTCCLGFTRPQQGVCVARHWRRPDRADAWGEPGVAEVAVGVDGEGHGIAAWVTGSMPEARTIAIAEEIDGTWVEQRPAVVLEGSAAHPSIAAGPQREVSVAWHQAVPDPIDATAPNDIGYLARRDRDGVWTYPSASAPLSLPPAGRDPHALATAWGETLVAWNQWTSRGGYGIALARRDAEGSLVRPADADDVLSPPIADSQDPRIAVAPNGDALLVWSQAAVDGGASMIYASERFRVHGAFSRPTADAFLSASGADAIAPTAAMGDRGHAAVVWTQGTDGATLVYLATRDSVGGWTRPRDLGDAFGPATGSASDPRVAFGGVELHVVWTQDAGSGARIWAAHRDDEGEWDVPGHDPTLLSSPEREAIEPSLAAGPHGEVIAAWAERGDDGRLRIASRRRNAGADRWSELDVLSPTDGHDAVLPVVAIGVTGRALVAWRQGPPGRERVRFATME